MASTGATLIRPAVAKHDEIRDAGVVRAARNIAIGYLRGFLVVLVLAHHSVLAYIDGAPPQATSLLANPPYWRAFMVVDSHHWVGFSLFTGFNDDFFMSLMFFVSGLFVWSSLQRKGNSSFVRDRLRRLGIPFLFAAVIIAPLAYYPSYLLTTGAHNMADYIHDWLSFGDWPTGPAWFIWLLLAFDLVAAALYAIRPTFGDALGRTASSARQHPVRFFLLLVAASAAVFIPMLAIFGAMSWTSIGPFQFQTARLFHYAVYFLAGIGVGAYGIDRGLLAPDGILARHWLRWTIAMLVVFAVSVVFMLVVISKGATMSPIFLNIVGGAMFALTCGAISFSFMALFVRFATRRRWLWDSLSDNEYGMYLIHYMFVSWLQLAILSAPLPAVAKGLLVFAGVLLLSWSTSATLRRIPAVSRIV
ncbi:acyltransferase family protein [Candidatus Binatus sp.]|uniref:acyltransferase family protein n=1 Tax=Candidatus Binatus sp. TaxID=2811406 RepID=UPI003BB1E467